ncbi:hypothetical protein [Tenacibaculum geojense]|uniref:Lipocalin-like domain-containing protein n=1 Tax=Tenacibaculum geojense TaxID=915352 RepID=A0ABW3JP49_9FLAO
MKKTILILILNLILYSCSSTLAHIKNKDEVAELLTGDWKLKNSESKTIYSFSFENLKGFYEESEPNDDGEYMIVYDSPIIEIIKKGKKFNLKFTDLLESWNSQIMHLDKENLILKTSGKETEYYKIE